tara:strand:- start:140 stop:319 length:180 start_codon:yes stop_codon:yes gene_type:complete
VPFGECLRGATELLTAQLRTQANHKARPNLWISLLQQGIPALFHGFLQSGTAFAVNKSL